MNPHQSIFTEAAQCQDCYKCLRQCAVKAIKIEKGHAMVMPELCVVCGHCVEICPVGAKKVRQDLDRAKLLIQMKKQVLVSLAPSYMSEFAGIPPQNLIAALKQLGFYGVSETALGAEEVSAAVAELINRNEKRVYFSSACPTAVALIKKYYPEYAENVTDLLSPMLAHCRLLKQRYGESSAIVFIGPCIAKKVEAEQHADLIDVAITFEDLRNWFKSEGIDPAQVQPEASDRFIPDAAKEGSLYPIDGGMIAGIRSNCTVNDIQFMAFSGIRTIQEAIKDLDRIKPDKPLFIEALACKGGCVNGPGAENFGSTVWKRSEVISGSSYAPQDIPRIPSMDIRTSWNIAPVLQTSHTEEEIKAALKRVGKVSREDELNCGTCGYDSCRAFADALLDGRAETGMCAGYMKKIANQKADALIRTMPSGVVIVDDAMRIVECNRRFAELMGEEILELYDTATLEGAEVRKVVPFYWMFMQALSQKNESIERDVRVRESVFHATVFTIEKNRLAGGILQDITAPAVQKEQIIKKAKEVNAKTLATVQQIAFLLGENAAESEVILNSIINSFSPEPAEGKDTDGKP